MASAKKAAPSRPLFDQGLGAAQPFGLMHAPFQKNGSSRLVVDAPITFTPLQKSEHPTESTITAAPSRLKEESKTTAPQVSRVKVVIRIRPLLKSEIEAGASNVLAVEGNQLLVSHPNHKSNSQQFVFDRIFENQSSTQLTSELIHREIGLAVLQTAWEGFDCCVLAYGGSGSGKSHAMWGAHDEGFIPRMNKALFETVERERITVGAQIMIEVSFAQIHDEQALDLLHLQSDGFVRVRDRQADRPTLHDLTTIAVTNASEMQRLIDCGLIFRSLFNTNSDIGSSRTHLLWIISITRRIDPDTSRCSKIYLWDLAGNQRLSKSTANKEGSELHSIASLARLLSVLSENNHRKPSNGHRPAPAPYADSLLTTLLKPALGGNCKTIMLATVSPSSTRFDDTIHTLRYGVKAKHILNRTVCNEFHQTQFMDQLRANVVKLSMQLADPTQERPDKERSDLTNQMQAQEKLLMELNQPWQDRIYSARIALENCSATLASYGLQLRTPQEQPYLLNLNQDPFINESLILPLKEGANYLGHAFSKRTEALDIKFEGLSIAGLHCILEWQPGPRGGVVYVKPSVDAATYINGELIRNTHPLENGDRIIFGEHHVFQLHVPGALDPRLKQSATVAPATVAGSTGSNLLALPNQSASRVTRSSIFMQNAVREFEYALREREQKQRGRGQQWCIDWDQLQILSSIESHSHFEEHFEVFRAKNMKDGTVVWVKTIKEDIKQEVVGSDSKSHASLVKAFCDAIEMHSQFRHPNIVQFLGGCTNPPHVCLVTEYLSRGSLKHNLIRSSDVFNCDLIAKIALDVAMAANYLLTLPQRLIHGNINSDTILLDQNFNAKLGGFQGEHYVFEDSACLPPEVHNGALHTEASDSYAFGVVLWEMVSGEPIRDTFNIQDVKQSIRDPTRLQSTPQELKEMIDACLEEDPQNRPTFAILIYGLNGLIQRRHPFGRVDTQSIVTEERLRKLQEELDAKHALLQERERIIHQREAELSVNGRFTNQPHPDVATPNQQAIHLESEECLSTEDRSIDRQVALANLGEMIVSQDLDVLSVLKESGMDTLDTLVDSIVTAVKRLSVERPMVLGKGCSSLVDLVKYISALERLQTANLYSSPSNSSHAQTNSMLCTVLRALRVVVEMPKCDSASRELILDSVLELGTHAGSFKHPVAESGFMEGLLHFLTTFAGDGRVIAKSIMILNVLGRDEAVLSSLMTQSYVPALVRATRHHPDQVEVQLEALNAISSLAMKREFEVLLDNQCVELVIDAMKRHSKDPSVQQGGAQALGLLCGDVRCKQVIQRSQGVAVVIQAIHNHQQHNGVQKAACLTFSKLKEDSSPSTALHHG
eukprot:GILJ01009868.1.p1 GENE.GILJ01009868.1~~GILJ01009868.1.p1  ORF type:complete len:1342 (-),score=241.70 GILJ01009868.1:272-4297(-)